MSLNTVATTPNAALAAQEVGLQDKPSSGVNQADLASVHERLKHFIWDWGEEGVDEWENIFWLVLTPGDPVCSAELVSISKDWWGTSSSGYVV